MEKILLKDVEDFKKFLAENSGEHSYFGYISTYLDENEKGFRPESYPCVAVYNIDDYGDSACLYAKFVYLDDFK